MSIVTIPVAMSIVAQGGNGAKSSILTAVALSFSPRSKVLAAAPCCMFTILPDGIVVNTLESTFLVEITDL